MRVARYYLSQILPPEPPNADPAVVVKDYYRLALSEAAPRVSFSAVIPTHPITGIPLFSWGVAYVVANDYSGVARDTRNFRLFPEVDDALSIATLLDRFNTYRWSDLTEKRRTLLAATFAALNIPSNTYAGSPALRQVLRNIGRFFQPDFDETKLFVV